MKDLNLLVRKLRPKARVVSVVVQEEDGEPHTHGRDSSNRQTNAKQSRRDSVRGREILRENIIKLPVITNFYTHTNKLNALKQ
jgi:hypothetical protein